MIIAAHRLNLRLTRPGTLLPWLGPALRGMVAWEFKEQVCRHPTRERRQRWRHCTGCPHLAECPYGQTYEPDLSPSLQQLLRDDQADLADDNEAIPPVGKRQVLPHDGEATRPLLLAPYFPVPPIAQPGLEVPLRLTLIGSAARHSAALLAALAEAGRRGLGDDRVGFELFENGTQPDVFHLRPEDLPATPDALPGTLPRVGVGLTAPLFLTFRSQRDGRRRPVCRPQFIDLFRAALRSVSRLFACCDRPLEVNWDALKEAAAKVCLLEHCYEPFSQPHRSSRSGPQRQLQGVAGGGVYADVPMSLVPWLVWGGRLHVGTYRVHGAGGWRLVLD